MHSYETPELTHIYMKKKVCILGGYENYKDEFQKRISSNCLPIENKHNIGVNISKIDFFNKFDQKFEFLLWNIDCSQNRSFLRRTFYSGADAIIFFVSEEKINQIQRYFNEIQSLSQNILLIFCIILENHSQQDIERMYFNRKDFFINNIDYSTRIYKISNHSDMFQQLSSFFLKKLSEKEIVNKIIIDFIHLDFLFGHSIIRDECDDYHEPEIRVSKTRPSVNLELLSNYLLNLDFDIEFESLNWIKIKNENLGTFSLYLKNGNVYYFPEVCEKCKEKKCSKFRNAPYFICIEAGDSNGWTNIKGFSSIELLILAKIVALKEGNLKNLPKSVLKQIESINRCEKRK